MDKKCPKCGGWMRPNLFRDRWRCQNINCTQWSVALTAVELVTAALIGNCNG